MAAEAAAQSTSQAGKITQQMLESFSWSKDGASFMWIIVLFGVIAVGISIHRFIFIYLKSSSGREKFMVDLAGLIKSGNLPQAENYAKDSNLPLAKCIHAVLSNRDKDSEGMEDARDDVFLAEAPKIGRYLNLIMTAANLCTMTGLIGTIYGLIAAFNAVANETDPEQKAKKLTEGISVAMGTTFLGLLWAIPLMLFHGLLTMQSQRLVEEMEEKSSKIIHLL